MGLTLLAGCAVSALIACAGSIAAQELAPDVMARSLLSAGDPSRLQRVFERARKGEPITVSVIGGSITQGASATKPEFRYGDRVAAWWTERFPKSKITLVNAGIGATGSDYAVQRAERDLLSKKPDFVIVEYGVNDGDTQACAETLEGLIRQILRQPQRPAIVLLFVMNDGGANAQAWHSKVGKHYALPMISYRDALWPEITAGRMKKPEIFADFVHPNDNGHALAARFITSQLETVLRQLPEGARAAAAVSTSQRALLTDRFDWTTIHNAGTLKPVRCDGWALDPAEGCWKATVPGSVIEFAVEGHTVFIQALRLHAPMGRASVTVDGGRATVLEGWFDQTWGGWRKTDVVGAGLATARHLVRVELLKERHEQSAGSEFRFYEIGTAGPRPRTGR